MTQQVNLLAPMFRKRRALLSARLSLLALVAVSAALGAGAAVGSWRTARLASEQVRLEQRRDQAAQRIEELGRLLAARAESTGDAELARLSAERDRKAQALALLARHDPGSARGFSPQFTGLARQHVDGLWLTRVELGAGQMALTGMALDEALVPRYLKRLGSEPVFAGTAFEHAKLERAAESSAAGLRFELRTRSAP